MLRKILAVDDSALIHQMYKLFLSRYKNCKLVSAMNGLEALDKLGQEEGIDLILLDINMPVMNGLEFLQRVQKEAAYKDIPVIIISTEGKEEDTIRGLKMGARGYVKKPFQASELHSLIEKITRPVSARTTRAAPLMDFEVSAELVGIYLEDAREHLARPRRRAPAPRARGPQRRRSPPRLLGPLHTLKGNSGMMGFTAREGLRPPPGGGARPGPRRGARRSTPASLDRLLAGSHRPARRGRDAPARPAREAARPRPRRRRRSRELLDASRPPGHARDRAGLAASRPTAAHRARRGTPPRARHRRERTAAADRARSSMVRVDFAKLDHLLNLVGELIVHRTKLNDLGRQIADARRPGPGPELLEAVHQVARRVDPAAGDDHGRADAADPPRLRALPAPRARPRAPAGQAGRARAAGRGRRASTRR